MQSSPMHVRAWLGQWSEMPHAGGRCGRSSRPWAWLALTRPATRPRTRCSGAAKRSSGKMLLGAPSRSQYLTSLLSPGNCSTSNGTLGNRIDRLVWYRISDLVGYLGKDGAGVSAYLSSVLSGRASLAVTLRFCRRRGECLGYAALRRSGLRGANGNASIRTAHRLHQCWRQQSCRQRHLNLG